MSRITRLLAAAACLSALSLAAPDAATLIRIESGTFRMGADSQPLPDAMLAAPRMSRRPSSGDYDETPAHKVTITYPFSIGSTEVTVEQFREFSPAYQGNPAFSPYAAGVSWHDAAAYCEWLSRKTGRTWRLPTEAEWEFAARKAPPGLRNMQSGPAEWCLDWHSVYPTGPQTDPVGPDSGIAKVVRGGGLDIGLASLPYFVRVSNRASIAPAFSSATGNIGFRVVEAPLPKTHPWPADLPFVQSAVKQTVPAPGHGPDPARPYYHVRRLFPDIGDRDMRTVGRKIGLAPGLGIAYHNSAVQVCPNGDLIAAWYDSPKDENDPDQTILSMRLRYGSEEWDMPDAWPDFADAADAAPVFWNDRGRLWLFFGSPRLIGAPPFQFITSSDSGATWSAVRFPNLQGPVGDYTPQPINSVVRASDGAIYLPVDGKGGTSVLFASKDDGQTWYDTGGRTGGRHTTLVLGKDGSLIGFGGKNTNIDGFMPVSVSRDGGKTYVRSKTQFLPLGNGQRPSVIRLTSGRLFFVADFQQHKKVKVERQGSFVALSDDDGATWKQRQLPDIVTVGYVTAAQGPDGLIHIVTSHNKPHDVNVDLNEAWVISGGPEVPTDARYLLNGPQSTHYSNGAKEWQATFKAGHKIGVETWWDTAGRKKWERNYAPDGTWTWRVYDAAGHVSAESRWKGKDLLEVLR